MFTIYTNCSIDVDGQITGLGVCQDPDGTRVYTREDAAGGYRVHQMPSPRYALSCDNPASGVPGRAEFERDVRALLKNLKEV